MHFGSQFSNIILKNNLPPFKGPFSVFLFNYANLKVVVGFKKKTNEINDTKKNNF